MTRIHLPQPLARVVMLLPRSREVYRHLRWPVKRAIRWLFTSRESTNYTYAISEQSKDYMSWMLAAALGRSLAEIRGYVAEVDGDAALRRHVIHLSATSPFAYKFDRRCDLGRRMAWYAVVRATRPRLVVETGVEKGLGSCVLTSALMRNAAEGHRGCYLGTDINPAAGWLFAAPYSDHGRILYGDSIESLRTITAPVDLFINDSDHSADYEAREYETITDHLAPDAVLISDNARVSDRLMRFSAAHARRFLYWEEEPVSHWGPGSGLGISVRVMHQ